MSKTNNRQLYYPPIASSRFSGQKNPNDASQVIWPEEDEPGSSKNVNRIQGCEITLAPEIKMLPPVNIVEHSDRILHGLKSALELISDCPDADWPADGIVTIQLCWQVIPSFQIIVEKTNTKIDNKKIRNRKHRDDE